MSPGTVNPVEPPLNLAVNTVQSSPLKLLSETWKLDLQSFIIAEILKINVRCLRSNENYERGRTLCSSSEFFARSRTESVVI